ncbi:hypothetical protein ACROYT_G008421 [Oculina patagonica]
MDSTSCLSNTSAEEFSDFYSQNTFSDVETGRTGGFYVGDLPCTNKHEPLDASHVARIMAREYKQEKEELEEKIAVLEAQCNAKEKEIAYLKESVSAKDKVIAHLKETVLELHQNGQTTGSELSEQNGQTTEIDFAKQMETIDGELEKTKENISQAEENLFRKKAEVESLQIEPQLFNAKDYFDPQPSWFDTLSNNTVCLQIHNYPVRAKDLDANRIKGSSDKKHENARISKTAEEKSCGPPQLAPVNSTTSPQADQNKPVVTKIEPNRTGNSQKRPVNPFRKAAAKGKSQQVNHQSPLFTPVNGTAVTSQAGQDNPPNPTQRNGFEAKATGSSQKPINPFRKAVKGNGYAHHRPLPFDGSQMTNTYPAYPFTQTSSAQPFPDIEQEGFLSRTFGKLFGY